MAGILLFLLARAAGGAAEPAAIVSYNVWFDDITGSVRYPQIIDHLAATVPAVICLQECTPAFANQLRTSRLAGSYTIHHLGQDRPYANLILTRGPARATGIVALPSRMGRVAPWVEVELAGTIHRVYSVHLESLDTGASPELRRRQLAAILADTASHPAILAGDFNFGEGAGEEAGLPDGWREAGAGGGPTFDPVGNSLAAATAVAGEEPRRLDRIIGLRTGDLRDYAVERVFYSDHYPIHATVTPVEPPR
jgi:endonuclease/exonuclease/phosphatase family metal-dependent hydrolase